MLSIFTLIDGRHHYGTGTPPSPAAAPSPAAPASPAPAPSPPATGGLVSFTDISTANWLAQLNFISVATTPSGSTSLSPLQNPDQFNTLGNDLSNFRLSDGTALDPQTQGILLAESTVSQAAYLAAVQAVALKLGLSDTVSQTLQGYYAAASTAPAGSAPTTGSADDEAELTGLSSTLAAGTTTPGSGLSSDALNTLSSQLAAFTSSSRAGSPGLDAEAQGILLVAASVSSAAYGMAVKALANESSNPLSMSDTETLMGYYPTGSSGTGGAPDSTGDTGSAPAAPPVMVTPAASPTVTPPSTASTSASSGLTPDQVASLATLSMQISTTAASVISSALQWGGMDSVTARTTANTTAVLLSQLAVEQQGAVYTGTEIPTEANTNFMTALQTLLNASPQQLTPWGYQQLLDVFTNKPIPTDPTLLKQAVLAAYANMAFGDETTPGVPSTSPTYQALINSTTQEGYIDDLNTMRTVIPPATQPMISKTEANELAQFAPLPGASGSTPSDGSATITPPSSTTTPTGVAANIPAMAGAIGGINSQSYYLGTIPIGTTELAALKADASSGSGSLSTALQGLIASGTLATSDAQQILSTAFPSSTDALTEPAAISGITDSTSANLNTLYVALQSLTRLSAGGSSPFTDTITGPSLLLDAAGNLSQFGADLQTLVSGGQITDSIATSIWNSASFPTSTPVPSFTATTSTGVTTTSPAPSPTIGLHINTVTGATPSADDIEVQTSESTLSPTVTPNLTAFQNDINSFSTALYYFEAGIPAADTTKLLSLATSNPQQFVTALQTYVNNGDLTTINAQQLLNDTFPLSSYPPLTQPSAVTSTRSAIVGANLDTLYVALQQASYQGIVEATNIPQYLNDAANDRSSFSAALQQLINSGQSLTNVDVLWQSAFPGTSNPIFTPAPDVRDLTTALQSLDSQPYYYNGGTSAAPVGIPAPVSSQIINLANSNSSSALTAYLQTQVNNGVLTESDAQTLLNNTYGPTTYPGAFTQAPAVTSITPNGTDANLEALYVALSIGDTNGLLGPYRTASNQNLLTDAATNQTTFTNDLQQLINTQGLSAANATLIWQSTYSGPGQSVPTFAPDTATRTAAINLVLSSSLLSDEVLTPSGQSALLSINNTGTRQDYINELTQLENGSPQQITSWGAALLLNAYDGAYTPPAALPVPGSADFRAQMLAAYAAAGRFGPNTGVGSIYEEIQNPSITRTNYLNLVDGLDLPGVPHRLTGMEWTELVDNAPPS